jgi:hypothetical protein
MSKTSLKDFLDFVSKINDDELLEVAEGLLRDIVEIERKREQIEALEEGLSEGKRAVFWMEAMSLNRDEIDLATNKIIGRRRFIHDQEAREKTMSTPDVSASEEGTVKEDEVLKLSGSLR